MPSQVLMLCLQKLDRNDLNLMKIITFLGLKSQIISLDDSAYALNYLREHFMEDDVCSVINCNALFRIRESGNITELKKFFSCRNTSMLIYNISPNEDVAQTISCLSEGKLRSVHHLASDAQKYTISNETIYITRHFHGLSLGPIHKKHDFTFNLITNQEDIVPLISINEHPFFVKYRREKCDVFLVANNRIVDIDKKINTTKPLCDYFSQLIPSVMFLKYIFGESCWHTQRVTANLTIDDPLLQMRYGFLNYRALIQEMDRHNICANIAFIPINYKKSDKDTARLFLDRPDRLSVCVHGSQHTHSEFGINDLDELNNKITLATRRMDEHERITGVPYEKVMIFPRGVFSSNTMKMLKYHNYHAAVNTEAVPHNGDGQLKISALLEPAIMTYVQFPLFLRRYPGCIADLAFDSFFGKPLLIVEHHNYFKRGYHNLDDLIQKIQTLDSSIRWNNLGNIVKQTYLAKNRNDGNIDVKMYANPTLIANTSETNKTYHIKKEETDYASIQGISILGGKIKSTEIKSDNIIVIAEIKPGTKAILNIEYRNNYQIKNKGKIHIDSTNVILRRYLSEIRDNYISKSQLLSSFICTGLKGVNRARDLIQNNNQMNDRK